MKTKNFIHLVSVALLFLWGAVMLYFYASGRIAHYLPPDGIFRPMVLVAGIGLIVMGLFNLATTQYAAADCCGHDHDHGHDHKHEHDECCGHDHANDHSNHHHEGHDHAHEPHDHGHGILEESGAAGRIIAILIIAAPVTWAAISSPDQYSANAVVNKGLYNQNYSSTARADQFSLRGEQGAKAPAKNAGAPKPATADTPPPAVAATPATSLPPAKTTADAPASAPPVATTAPPTGAKEAKSYGGFTLADLEAQVPRSKAGNFILDVPELYYTAGDKEVQGVLTGQSVETIAQVLPEKVNNPDGKRLRVFRMLIQCCAADARPYSIPVQFADKAPVIKDMTWVKVTGKMNYKQEGGQTVPILEAGTMEETTAPENATVY